MAEEIISVKQKHVYVEPHQSRRKFTMAMFKARVRRDPYLPTCGLQYKAQIKVALWPLK